MAKKLHSDPVTSHFAEMLKIQTVRLWHNRGYNFSSGSTYTAQPTPAPLLVLRIWLQL